MVRLAFAVVDELHRVADEERNRKRAGGEQRAHHRPVATKPAAHEALGDIADPDAPLIPPNMHDVRIGRVSETCHRLDHVRRRADVSRAKEYHRDDEYEKRDEPTCKSHRYRSLPFLATPHAPRMIDRNRDTVQCPPGDVGPVRTMP